MEPDNNGNWKLFMDDALENYGGKNILTTNLTANLNVRENQSSGNY